MGFIKPIEQYLFCNLLTKMHVFMYLKDIIRGREEMTKNIIIKTSVQKRFDSFMVHGRVLFFSAPCGFGKTVLADACLLYTSKSHADHETKKIWQDDTS